MADSLNITQARSQLPRLAEELRARRDLDAIALTRHGEPVLALMPWELYETLIDTLDVLSDPLEIERFRKGLQELNEGETVPWKEARAQLDL